MPTARRPATPGAAASTRAARPAAGRADRDQAAIARLAEDLLPALIARLGASGLGEIEVRQGEWKARLRKPAGAGEALTAGAAAYASAGPGHSGGGAARGDHSAAASAGAAENPCAEEPKRPAATSPAVGIYHPAKDLTVGMRVRAGDRIGTVDVLGVHQDVKAPVEGVVGSSLAEAGEAVEYGQELVRIEPLDSATTAAAAVVVIGAV
jgi:biotin carboxyl carrier protein